MEEGYIEAKSDNLPVIDPFMISVFFMDNMNYLSAEIKGVKNVRAAREGYGDHAVGYVQLKRVDNICIVKGKITPEHRVTKQAYNVSIKVDEDSQKIILSECHDCVASHGGCKHAIAFLYWLLRRSEEPSPTSVECYWKKPLLSKIGTGIKTLKASDLKPGEELEDIPEQQDFLGKVIAKAKEQNCNANLIKYFVSDTSVRKLSVHRLGSSFLKNTANPDMSSFIEYCKSHISEELCQTVAEETCDQYKSPLWYELRYGRITASKIYEASRCSTLDGSLFEQILGAVSLPDSEAMRRGRHLEENVLQVVAKEKNIKLNRTGLILNRYYPLLGASPDAISDEYVIEVKCPSSEKTVSHYFRKGKNINKKYISQIQLQMMFCNKQKGLFCIASPDFELTKNVDILEVEYDESFIQDVILDCMKFWENAIYPHLVKQFSSR